MISRLRKFLRGPTPPVPEFVPHLTTLQVGEVSLRFLIATQLGDKLYNPAKPHAVLEYEYVLRELNLAGRRILDCGAHHGHYAIVLAHGSGAEGSVTTVDAFPGNMPIIEINMVLNGFEHVTIKHGAVTPKVDRVLFAPRSNGRIKDEPGSFEVDGQPPHLWMPDAQVVKIDIEGEEFTVLPEVLDKMPAVDTWIVEVHPDDGQNPADLVDLFKSNGFGLEWVNRATDTVEAYPADAVWSVHTTLFARR